MSEEIEVIMEELSQPSHSLLEKLMLVQSALKAPKGQRNNFGKYNYRSCEDILEAVKPHLLEHRLALTMSDGVQQVGARFYVVATATLHDVDGGETVRTMAAAREEETKKGMDGSQITGAASSYARKYALNALFAIDDTKDADATNTHGKQPAQQQQAPQQQADEGRRVKMLARIAALRETCERNGVNPGGLDAYLQATFGTTDVSTMGEEALVKVGQYFARMAEDSGKVL
jgi:hypothetical protein